MQINVYNIITCVFKCIEKNSYIAHLYFIITEENLNTCRRNTIENTVIEMFTISVFISQRFKT